MIWFFFKVILLSFVLIYFEKLLGFFFVELLIFMLKRFVVNDSGRKIVVNIVNFRRCCFWVSCRWFWSSFWFLFICLSRVWSCSFCICRVVIVFWWSFLICWFCYLGVVGIGICVCVVCFGWVFSLVSSLVMCRIFCRVLLILLCMCNKNFVL